MKGDFTIGNKISLIPKEEWSDLKDINTFMEKIGMYPKEYWMIRNYMIKEFKKLGILKPILMEYSNDVCTEINVTMRGNHRGFQVTIDDPYEVGEFLKGEGAIGFDSDGGEHEIIRGDSDIVDWNEDKYEYFYFKRPWENLLG